MPRARRGIAALVLVLCAVVRAHNIKFETVVTANLMVPKRDGVKLAPDICILQQGAWDQRGGEAFWNWRAPIPLSARNDVVVFQTEPLADDIEGIGGIEVKLCASSSAIDPDFTAKLIDAAVLLIY